MTPDRRPDHAAEDESRPKPWIGLAPASEELARLRQSVWDRTASLDTKAGLVLGFAGVLVALIRDHPTPLKVIAQALALLAAGLAVCALWPTTGKELNPRVFRDRYMLKPEEEARLGRASPSSQPARSGKRGQSVPE
jgi:hypothetical protein